MPPIPVASTSTSSAPFPVVASSQPIPDSETSTFGTVGTRSQRSNSASTAHSKGSVDTDVTSHPPSAFSPSNSANTSQTSAYSHSHSRSGSGSKVPDAQPQLPAQLQVLPPSKPDFITPRTIPLPPTFTTMPATPAQSTLFPIQRLLDDLAANPYAFAYHLQKTYVTILAAKEAMWDELCLRLAVGDKEKIRVLKELGWEGGGFRDDEQGQSGGSRIYYGDEGEGEGMGMTSGVGGAAGNGNGSGVNGAGGGAGGVAMGRSSKEWDAAQQRGVFDKMVKEFEKYVIIPLPPFPFPPLQTNLPIRIGI